MNSKENLKQLGEQVIGIIGAGVMGKGVAQRFIQYGYQIILYDINSDVRNKVLAEIEKNLRVASMFNKMINVEESIARINIISQYEDLKNADYIIENVTENIDIKISVYQQLENVCKSDCIYMVNTSCVPITLLASKISQANKVIGVHFMNPVPINNFAEVIKGWHTSEETIMCVKHLLNGVGIEIEIVNDSAGFVSNRVSHLFMNEAAMLVYEGVATPKQIDNIFKNAFGHKMGPLETADLIGIDVVLDSLKVLYEHYEDSKYRACPLLKQMVYAGRMGRKSGSGFYDY